ncbi:MAG: NAD-dependent DNA ligase LigA [Clostridiales Family XIII bacterium]|nr:NAD-dependent DNA ligase LigA [Clostridiales Family XIII bacterium]
MHDSEQKAGDKTGRMRELVRSLLQAAKAYYSESREIMPNLEYDMLYDELSSLESETGIVLAGSPTQRVGYEVSSELAKETHSHPMLSLEKTKDASALADWLGEKSGILSWKLDGLTVALTYEGGELSRAVTRGDGTVGEVITNNAKAFRNLPLRIPYRGRLLLRGEAVISYSDFDKINEEIGDAEAKYKNPRNLASGSVRQLDPEVTASRRVRFYAFALVSADAPEPDASAARQDAPEPNAPEPDAPDIVRTAAFATRTEQMDFLAKQGFSTVEYYAVDAGSIEGEVKRFAERASHSDLPSDGLVLIYDDIAYGESLGRTAKFPRDAIAFKWEDELAETTLEYIEWSASRTGLINPIAVFSPVEIEGTTVSRASLHNISIMNELALGEGDTIRVYKANMIIPQVAENLTRSGSLTPPDACPVCGAATEIRDADGILTLQCPNPACAAKKIKSFTHFVGRSAMNIEGLSEQTIEKLIAAGFIHGFADIFRLAQHRDEIVAMDGFGEKSYENLIAATSTAATNASRARLLNSLGISGIGAANSRVICRAFGYDWDRITGASYDELVQIDGIGDVLAEGYTAWWSDEKNSGAVSDILSLVTLDPSEGAAGTAGAGASGEMAPLPLAGKTFVITGSLETYANRDELKERIENAGGRAVGSVSEKTDYLVNNDIHSGSSKNKKAKQLGVKIITEAEMNNMFA